MAAAATPVVFRPPRFGGIFWKLSRRTTAITLPLAGRRWNPAFAVVVTRGRRTGLRRSTPVAARRVAGGFIISLAFGAHADWYRNLATAGSATIRWRGKDYAVSAPQPVAAEAALAAFNPVQRLGLRLARVHGYVRVADAVPAS